MTNKISETATTSASPSPDAAERIELLSAQLKEAMRDAKSNEVRVNLACSTAHELNTLFSVITGFTEMALETLPGDHPERPGLKQVLRAAKRAEKLVAKFQKLDKES